MANTANYRKAGQALADFVDEVDGFIFKYATAKKAEDFQAAGLILAGKVQQLIQLYPHTTLALAVCRLSQQRLATQLAVSTAILTGWVLNQQRWQSKPMQIQIASALCCSLSLASAQPQTSASKTMLKSFQLAKHHGLSSPLWQTTQLFCASTLLTDKHYSAHRLHRVPPSSSLIASVFHICWHVFCAEKARSMAAIIRTLWFQKPHMQQALTDIVTHLPAIYPGSINHSDIGRVIVVGQEQSNAWVKPLDQGAEPLMIDAQQIKEVAGPLKVKSAKSLANLWADTEISSALLDLRLAISVPQSFDSLAPPSELNHLLALDKEDKLDARIIDKALQENPGLRKQITQIASAHNREQQNINDVKHAVLLLGLNRTPKLLAVLMYQQLFSQTRHADSARQQYWLHLLNHAASVVSDYAGIQLAEDLSLYICLYFTPDFIQPKQSDQLYRPRQNMALSSGMAPDILSKFELAADELESRWRKLLTLWHLPTAVLEAFKACQTPATQMQLAKRAKGIACQLQLILLAAKHIHNGGLNSAFDSDMRNEACDELSISPNRWDGLVNKVQEAALPYTPI